MADRIRIRCINKVDRQNIHERITNVGGWNLDANGKKIDVWTISQKACIDYIENKTYEFYVHVKDEFIDVIVAVSASGNKYIKTKKDGLVPDNLLSLPECS